MSSRKPRGSWVGKGGWHPQVTVVAPFSSTQPAAGERIEVDELIAPILLALWQIGFPTGASCQNAPLLDADDTESGEAHIHFLTIASAERFAAIIGDDAITYAPRRSGRSVAFPTQRIPEIGTLVNDYADYWFAVAVHEAGHAVLGAYVGFDIVEIRLHTKGGGQTVGKDFAGERVDYLAQWSAGDAAVEEICGSYRLPIDTKPNSDQNMQERDSLLLSATDLEHQHAETRAREIVHAQRAQIITIAKALLVAEGGRLAGVELEALLTPVWAAR